MLPPVSLLLIIQSVHSLNTVSHVNLTKNDDGSFDLKMRKMKTLHLRKKDRNVNLWLLGENEKFEKQHNSQAPQLFEDPAAGATLLIEEDGSGQIAVSGVVGGAAVVAGRAGAAASDCPGCLSLAPLPAAQPDADYEEVAMQYSLARRARNLLPDRIHPEILVIVDFWMFEKLKFDVERSHKYVTAFFNAVNLRFQTITAPRIELSIAGIVIAKSKKTLSYITKNIKKSSMLDAPTALHDMGRYFYAERAELPVYDMVVTLTGLDMARKKAGKMSRATSGYAYVGGACVRNVYLKKISSVALVEDSGGYSGVVVAAHELGHLLGAVHDGDAAPAYLRGPGAASCPWSRGFIMSDLRRTARGQTWSDCSVKQMRHFLRTATARCLTNSPHTASSEYKLAGAAALPGATMTVDEQCKADRGTRSCYHDHRVCTQLFCYNSDYRGCYAYRPAVEGSKCGAGRHCISGKCVAKFNKTIRVKQPAISLETPTVKTTKTTTTTKKISTHKFHSETTTQIFSTQKPQKIVEKPLKKIVKKSNNELLENPEENPAKLTVVKNNFKSEQKMKARMPKEHIIEDQRDSNCSDSLKVLGSLTCEQLFQRYAFHYCKNNRVIKKKCCQSYKNFCGSAPR